MCHGGTEIQQERGEIASISGLSGYESSLEVSVYKDGCCLITRRYLHTWKRGKARMSLRADAYQIDPHMRNKCLEDQGNNHHTRQHKACNLPDLPSLFDFLFSKSIRLRIQSVELGLVDHLQRPYPAYRAPTRGIQRNHGCRWLFCACTPAQLAATFKRPRNWMSVNSQHSQVDLLLKELGSLIIHVDDVTNSPRAFLCRYEFMLHLFLTKSYHPIMYSINYILCFSNMLDIHGLVFFL
jgi:hypothetical protein